MEIPIFDLSAFFVTAIWDASFKLRSLLGSKYFDAQTKSALFFKQN